MIYKRILRVLGGSLTISVFLTAILTIYLVGYGKGFSSAANQAQEQLNKILEGKVGTSATLEKGKTGIVHITPKPAPPKPTWGGPELWEAVNKRRVEFGVNPLNQKDELCTIASIRLNQLLELGKLDGHEGFSKLPEDRPDLKWIFDKYNISEFLVAGVGSAAEAVSLWENTLGHKKLLSGGEYSWGCIYAQNGFGVAIAAY